MYLSKRNFNFFLSKGPNSRIIIKPKIIKPNPHYFLTRNSLFFVKNSVGEMVFSF